VLDNLVTNWPQITTQLEWNFRGWSGRERCDLTIKFDVRAPVKLCR
jgi:hypothetical protein